MSAIKASYSCQYYDVLVGSLPFVRETTVTTEREFDMLPLHQYTNWLILIFNH